MIKLFRSMMIALILTGIYAAPHKADPQNTGRTVTITASRFKFQPSEITLKQGEPVTLALTSEDVPHSLLIEALGVNASAVKGRTTTATVTPQQVGDFKGRCGRFCGGGHGSMSFLVHVVAQ